MESITKNLNDPAWWFSTVLIAVFAGIAAAFAKDWLEERYGIFLRWSADKRAQTKAERQLLISRWSSSEALLTIAILQMLFWTSGYFAMALMVSIYITYLRLKFNYNGLLGVEALSHRQIATLSLSVLAVAFYSFKVAGIVSVTADMIKAFRTSRGLPPFAE